MMTQNTTFAWFTLIKSMGHPVVFPCEALSENFRCNQEQVLPTPVLNISEQDDQLHPSHMSICIPLDNS